MAPKQIVTLGMFIIDTFQYLDEDGNDVTNEQVDSKPAIGGGGTYCAVGARIWLPPSEIGMVVDRGHDFPSGIQSSLNSFGTEMWHYRDQPDAETTRAVNIYRGDYRGFEYLTPRIRITPLDLTSTSLANPKYLHFICSPERASAILSEVDQIDGWEPFCIYEPIPDRCVPQELPALRAIIKRIHVLSPNAEEALCLLSIELPPSRERIELAADTFLSLGAQSIIIRSGALGAYVKSTVGEGRWIPAYFTEKDKDRVVDVTGAGNAFLGGLAAGLYLSNEDLYTACLYATISASFTIEQKGLPVLSSNGSDLEPLWNGESPKDRLVALRSRLALTARQQ